MSLRYALPLLLALLLLSSCIIATEKRDNPLPTLAAQAQAPTATQLPSTATATLPRATVIPLPTEPATPTFTPTPSLTPIPTYDPSSAEPTFGILFLGIPCPASMSSCNDMLSQSTPAEPYFIHSDGTNLVKLSESDDFPSNLHRVWRIQYAEDGSQFAYPSLGEEGQVELSVVNVGEASATYSIPMPSEADLFDYLPEPNCFAFFTINSQEKKVVTEKRCAGSEASEILDTTIFSSNVSITNYEFVLAPTGNKVARVDGDKEGSLFIYVKEFGEGTSPTQVLHISTPCEGGKFSGPIEARKRSDGETIEFAASFSCGEKALISFYSVGWSGENLNELLFLELENLPKQLRAITEGDWSPNGNKFVFTQEGLPAPLNGLYVLDLQTGEIKQILSGFYLGEVSIRTWQPTINETDN